jgi:hypothetical protein
MLRRRPNWRLITSLVVCFSYQNIAEKITNVLGLSFPKAPSNACCIKRQYLLPLLVKLHQPASCCGKLL